MVKAWKICNRYPPTITLNILENLQSPPPTITLSRVIASNLSKKCRSPISLLRLNYIIYLADYSNKFQTTSYIKNLPTDLENLFTFTMFWEIWSIFGKSLSNSSQKALLSNRIQRQVLLHRLYVYGTMSRYLLLSQQFNMEPLCVERSQWTSITSSRCPVWCKSPTLNKTWVSFINLFYKLLVILILGENLFFLAKPSFGQYIH